MTTCVPQAAQPEDFGLNDQAPGAKKQQAAALAAASGSAAPGRSGDKTRSVGVDRAVLGELMARAQVRKFGTNVNQAVAELHATGAVPGWLAEAVELTGQAVRRVDAAAELIARRLP